MAFRFLPPAPAMLLVGATFATVATATYSLPATLVSATRVGFAFGFITAFSNLGNLAGPAIAGGIHDRTGKLGAGLDAARRLRGPRRARRARGRDQRKSSFGTFGIRPSAKARSRKIFIASSPVRRSRRSDR